MNKQQLIDKLHELANSRLSVRALEGLRDASREYLVLNSAEGDGCLLPVFEFMSVVDAVLPIVDDEGFPEAAKIDAHEKRYWPLLRRCIDTLQSETPLDVADYRAAVEAVIRTLYTPSA